MLFYLILRFWFALALHVYAFFHARMPTNQLVRWVNTDRGIQWGLPIGAALTPLYYLAMTWSGEHLNAGGPGWWWVPTLWGAMNTIKFAHVAIRSPFGWTRRTLRQSFARQIGHPPGHRPRYAGKPRQRWRLVRRGQQILGHKHRVRRMSAPDVANTDDQDVQKFADWPGQRRHQEIASERAPLWEAALAAHSRWT